MEITQIDLSKITVNDYNPNAVPEKTMNALKASMKRDGFLQPLLVKQEGKDKYVLIDGEHRYTAAHGIYPQAPCIVLDSDDRTSKIITIAMNRFRGEFDTIKLAELIVDLRERHSDEELEELMGFSQEEIGQYADLIDIDSALLEEDQEIMDAMNSVEDIVNSQLVNLKEIFTVRLPKETHAEIMGLLLGRNLDAAESLVSVCREYLDKEEDNTTEKEDETFIPD